MYSPGICSSFHLWIFALYIHNFIVIPGFIFNNCPIYFLDEATNLSFPSALLLKVMDSLDLRDGRYLKTHIIFSSIFPEFKLFGGLYPSFAHFLPKNGICGPQWEAHQFLLFYWLVFYQGNGDLWVAFVIVCAIILSCVGIALSSWLKAQTMILKRDNPSSRPFFESGRMWLVRGIPQQENFHPVWC